MWYKIFFNSLGEFQWASVATIIAFIPALTGVFFSVLGYKNTKQTLKQQKEITERTISANLKAKARIDWIQKVREASSSFLSSVLKLKGLTNERIGSINSQTSRTLDDKIINELNQFQEKRLLLKLYFGTNTENNKVVDDIEKINTIVSKFIKSQQTGTLDQNNYESFMKDIDENVETFNEAIRKYLKFEWDRAKKGE